MIPMVEDKKAEIADLCKRYGVERMDLFDSAAGNGFDSDSSDLDFVVSFERCDPPALFDRYFGRQVTSASRRTWRDSWRGGWIW
jgi:predicted nucleotidyltransferase